MKTIRTLAAELRKLFTLPSTWIGMAVGLVAPAAFTLLSARQGRQFHLAISVDDGYNQLATLGVIGAIIIGVTTVSSEYAAEDSETGGGRPITTTLSVIPRRMRLLLAKLGASGITVAILAAVATPVTLIVNNLANAQPAFTLTVTDATRGLGVIIFWVLTAWISLGITLLTRSGVIPLALLIINNTTVSVSYALSHVAKAANLLPDLAGCSMFIRTRATTMAVAPVTGGLVMAAWTLAILLAGGIALYRRDA